MAQRSRRAAVVLLRGEPREPAAGEATSAREAAPGARLPAPEDAHVDGRRVVIEAAEEIVLQCGKASVTLRRDGRIVIRGVNVVSQADEVQKIRGGTVRIN